MDKTKIIFTSETVEYIIEALEWFVDDQDHGLITDVKTKKYILDVHGKPFMAKDIIAICKHGVITSFTQAIEFFCIEKK